MHRSITLSSTFSYNDHDESTHDDNKEKFIIKIAIGLVEFLVSSLFLCYGILFAEYVDDGTFSVEKGLWTMIVYSSARHIAAPATKCLTEYLEERSLEGFRYIVCISTCFLFIGLVLPAHILSYGIFGGFFSNLISTQLRYFATKRCGLDDKAFEGNIQSARAISLMITPHLLLFLVESFVMDHIVWIFAAYLLNIIPAALILRPLENLKTIRYPEMSRYHTLPAFSRQVTEMVEFSNSTNLLRINNPDSGFIDINDEENEENNKENEHDENSSTSLKEDILTNYSNVIVEDTNPPLVPLTPNTVQMYYSNIGVSILPEIPEEPEEVQQSKKDMIDPKRLSTISTILEGINLKESEENNRRLSGENSNEILSINDLLRKVENREEIQKIEYIPNYRDNRNSFLKEIGTIRKTACCSCSAFTNYLWKQRFRTLKYFCMDFILKPLTASISEPLFYPILISKVTLTFNSSIYFSVIPYLALQKNAGYKREDTAFLLSYIAFAWCLFLVFLPLVATFKNGKLSLTYILGLLLTSTSMIFFTKQKMTNDFITWSCLLYGCGFGMIKYTDNMVYKSTLNERRMKYIDSSVETFCGLFVILGYYLIYFYRLDVLRIFPLITFSSNLVLVVIWSVVPQITVFVGKLKKRLRKREVHESFL